MTVILLSISNLLKVFFMFNPKTQYIVFDCIENTIYCVILSFLI
nr:MAG TPA: hypothetical protein [Caudoviricetes sp.]